MKDKAYLQFFFIYFQINKKISAFSNKECHDLLQSCKSTEKTSIQFLKIIILKIQEWQRLSVSHTTFALFDLNLS